MQNLSFRVNFLSNRNGAEKFRLHCRTFYCLLSSWLLVTCTTGYRMVRNFWLPDSACRTVHSVVRHPDCQIHRCSHRNRWIYSCLSDCGCCFRIDSGCYSGNDPGCCSERDRCFRCERGFCCYSEIDSDLLFFSFWTFLCSFPVHVLFSNIIDVAV